ncbi:ABC transporter ATP-binding protein [Streptomyces spectabilis]|uniref:ABC transporter ATP-binding protein n=1 Tax=Streptomyces spectabilis TaxID=68270 RepID=A0A5P2XDT4_STRST|nr:ABC transporter ATP-binding protein [Streptomyces spectabilis]MBB5106933.1 ABC-type multidrug transport system ATPase subunit [Streptomyces spectabilis]MCI3906337.1 ABC transporter ATP-binding protein [Streptomyces spectabilis]QEV63197.1 ABC transporter ATP-binding protein [Streptomyces spectabilis]GGV41317.1 ABC transporter ATP-binding protein [Streptomyces spectabilis]
MTTRPEPALTARDIHKAFGKHQVLRGADLTVEPGQLVAVVGENGAGKSTFLKAIAGTLPVDRGEVRLSGELGYCPQDPVLNANLTVDQHLHYFAAAHRLGSLDRADELVDLLGYDKYRSTAAGDLSGGTRQKLNLTLALLHDPDVLLLDEPYQGFDWETYLRFWDLVDKLHERDKAVVVITHLVFEQERFDVLADLVDGRLAPRRSEEEQERRHAAV